MEVSSADNRSFSQSRTPSLAFMTISPPLYTTPKFHFMRTVQAAEFTSGKEFTPERLATNFTSPRILFGLRQPRLDLRVRRLAFRFADHRDLSNCVRGWEKIDVT